MTKAAKPVKAKLETPTRAQLHAVIAPGPQARQHDSHPHENLDRASRAAVAMMLGGVSPHAFRRGVQRLGGAHRPCAGPTA